MARKFDDKKLLIASGNQGKVKEISSLLSKYPLSLVSVSEYNCEEPEENGTSFKANAEIKAEYYAKVTGLPALADDSGLVIPDLDGQPGIYSARWAGADKNFLTAMKRIEDMLHEKFGADAIIQNEAYFVCALTIYWPSDHHFETFEGRLEGHIQFPPSGTKGFGYDPIFVPKGYNNTLAELSPDIKNQISHRSEAFKQLVNACFAEETIS